MHRLPSLIFFAHAMRSYSHSFSFFDSEFFPCPSVVSVAIFSVYFRVVPCGSVADSYLTSLFADAIRSYSFNIHYPIRISDAVALSFSSALAITLTCNS